MKYDPRLLQDIDDIVRDAITYAEAEYDEPHLVLLMHPEIARAVKYNMNPDAYDRMENAKVEGHNIFETTHVCFGIFVCGESLSSERLRRQRKIKQRILGS